MKIRISSLMIFLSIHLSPNSSIAQQMLIDWENTIGGNCGDCLTDLIALEDGGFVLFGHSCSDVSYDKTEPPIGGAFDMDLWLVKVDSNGDVLWDRTIGGTGLEYGASIVQTADGGLLLGAMSSSGISGNKSEASRGGRDFWLVKVDASGNFEWDKTIGSSGNEQMRVAQQTPDGGYLVVGHGASEEISADKTVQNKGGDDVWIVKLSIDRQIEWQRTLGGSSLDYCSWSPVVVEENGSIFIGATSVSSISGDKSENAFGDQDYWLVKLNSDGDIIWQRTIGGTGLDALADLQLDEEGNTYCFGLSNSGISGLKTEASYGSSDYWIVKVSSNGEVLWDKTIGGSGGDQLYFGRIRESGNVILGGSSSSGISGLKTEESYGTSDYWALELGLEQNIIWQKTASGNDSDFLYGMAISPDGGVLLGGCSESEIGFDKTEPNFNGDYWIVKLMPDEVVGIETEQTSSFRLYPNPVSTTITLEIPSMSEPQRVTIYDALGRVVNTNILSLSGTHSISIEHLTSGVYAIEVVSANSYLTKKFLKK